MENEDRGLKGLVIEQIRAEGDHATALHFFEDQTVALKLRCDGLEARLEVLEKAGTR